MLTALENKHTVYFVAGTDTGVGKTFCTLKLLESARQQGLKTVAFKPVATACTNKNGFLENDDALQLQTTATIKLDYRTINPYAFEPPISPNIASEQINHPISIQKITDLIRDTIQQHQPDLTLIEGTGGWLCPISDQETMADIPSSMHTPIILVVSLKLGCLNHALLTYENIQSRGLPFAGWIGNCFDPDMLHLNENIQTLRKRLGPELYLQPSAASDRFYCKNFML